MALLVEIVGWIGMVLILWAYFLVSYGKVDGANKIFQWMNFWGAIFIAINVFYHNAWPSFVLNMVWAVIAIMALWRRK